MSANDVGGIDQEVDELSHIDSQVRRVERAILQHEQLHFFAVCESVLQRKNIYFHVKINKLLYKRKTGK